MSPSWAPDPIWVSRINKGELEAWPGRLLYVLFLGPKPALIRGISSKINCWLVRGCLASRTHFHFIRKFCLSMTTHTLHSQRFNDMGYSPPLNGFLVLMYIHELGRDSGPLHTRAKSCDYDIVRTQTKVSKGRLKTLPNSCTVVTDPQV